MMFTGTPEELAERTEKARRLLEQIATCLNELEELAPGCTYASNGEIGGLGATVRGRGMGATWEVRGQR